MSALTTVLGVFIAATLSRRGQDDDRRHDALVAAHASARRLDWLVLIKGPQVAVEQALDDLATAVSHPLLREEKRVHEELNSVTLELARLIAAGQENEPMARQTVSDSLRRLVVQLSGEAGGRPRLHREMMRGIAAFFAFSVAVFAGPPPAVAGVLLVIVYLAVWRLRW